MATLTAPSFGARLLRGPMLQSPFFFLVSVVASVASFTTTYLGMESVVPFFWLAAIITFVLQSVIFGASWNIGALWSRRDSRFWGNFLMFVIAAIVSIFFSFAAFLKQIETNRSIDAVVTVAEGVAANVLTRVGELLEKDRKDAFDNFVNIGAYPDWKKNHIDALVTAAAGAGKSLKNVAGKRRDELTKEVNNFAGEVDKLRPIKARLEVQYSSQIEESKRLAKEFATFQNELRGLRTDKTGIVQEIKKYKGIMKAERDSRIGPKYRKARGLLKTEEGLLENINSALSDKEAQITNVKTLIAENNALTDPRDPVEGSLGEIRKKIGELDAEIAEMKVELKQNSSFANFDAKNFQKQIDAALGRISSEKDIAALKEAQKLCSDLKQNMSSNETLRAKITNIDCRPANVQTLSTELALRQGEAQKFRKEHMCTARQVIKAATVAANANRAEFASLPLTQRVSRGKEVSREQFRDIISRTFECFRKLEITNEAIEQQRNRIEVLERDRGPDAHTFTRAQVALVIERNPLSYFSLTIAIVLDLLVLLCAIIGTGSLQNSKILDLTEFLNSIVPISDDEEYEGEVNLPENPGSERTRLTNVYNRLARVKKAEWLNNSKMSIRLKKGAIDWINREIAIEENHGILPQEPEPSGDQLKSNVTVVRGILRN